MAVWARYLLLGAITGFGALRQWSSGDIDTFVTHVAFFVLIQASVCFVLMGSLNMLELGNAIVGKNRTTGTVPMWSYVVYAPFHAFLAVKAKLSSLYHLRVNDVEPATQIVKNLYVGNLFSQEVADTKGFQWHAVVDLTCEFTERCESKHYLNLPLHDGNPPSLSDFANAAQFVEKHIKLGPILIHCAHGIGRSATLAAGCMTALQLRRGVMESFAAIKAKRSICHLNRKSRAALLRFEKALRTVGLVGLKSPQ